MKKVVSPRELRIKNKRKEIHFFNEEYTTKQDKKTAENQDGDEWEVVNGTCRAVTSNYHVKGSHHKFDHPEKKGSVTVIHPRKDYPVGTLKV